MSDHARAAALFDAGRLTLAREAAGLTKAALAEDTGVTPAAISQYESQANRPSAATVGKLAWALGVTPGFFESRGRPVPMPSSEDAFFRSLRATTRQQRRQASARAGLLAELALILEEKVELPPLTLRSAGIDLDSSPNVIIALATHSRRARARTHAPSSRPAARDARSIRAAHLPAGPRSRFRRRGHHRPSHPRLFPRLRVRGPGMVGHAALPASATNARRRHRARRRARTIRQPHATGTWTEIKLATDTGDPAALQGDVAILQPIWARFFGVEHYLGMEMLQFENATVHQDGQGTVLRPGTDDTVTTDLLHPEKAPLEAARRGPSGRGGRALFKPADEPGVEGGSNAHGG